MRKISTTGTMPLRSCIITAGNMGRLEIDGCGKSWLLTRRIRGSRAGSWSPRGYQWGSQAGRIYVTSLAVCTLEIYYRHLPIFKQIELDAP